MIAFPSSTDPRVSVVMVTWNSSDWVLRSLEALAANTSIGYEVIVVDNNSTDGTTDLLRTETGGLTTIRSDRNTGFGMGSNLGALRARAELLCFLNPDALVPPRWDVRILEEFRDPTVGIAGPLLVNPDGSTQEAGHVVSCEGHTMQFGNGDPTLLHAAKRRVVSLGGTCMSVRRSAFEEVGGFDPFFHPAYNEDVDLCFSVRSELGLHTLLCPQVMVTHAAGTSVGAPLAEDLKFRTAETLASKWSAELSSAPTLAELQGKRSLYWSATDVLTRERVLIVGSPGAADSKGLARLAAFASEHPDCRFTFLAQAAGRDDIEAAGAGGLEVAAPPDLDRWLDERFGHYTFLVDLEDPATPNEPVERAIISQPNCELLPLEALQARLRGAKSSP